MCEALGSRQCGSTVRGPIVGVECEQRGAVLVVTLDRPDAANAIDGAMAQQLTAAFAQVSTDESILVVVLTGAGRKTFCSGMDLKAFTAGDDMNVIAAGVATVPACPKPVIAAVNGAALAGGFEMVLNCDLAVAADHARFGMPEVKRGLIAAGGGFRLPLRIPLAVALEMGLTGEPIDAYRAYELGLVNRVVAAGDVLTCAFELAGRIADNGPLAVRITKQLMLGQLPAEDRERTLDIVAPVFASVDAQEGARSFAEKRPPRWLGR
jgi:enoyl-CoA hydratase